MHTNWRDCKAWSDIGLRMSTSSNEACKLYDATLSQIIGWYDEDSVGGIENGIAKMLEADNTFVMGQVIANGLELIGTGTSMRQNKDLAQRIDNLLTLSKSNSVLDRERKHVDAVKLWADGHMSKATEVWEDILVEYPLDLLAIKFAHDTYFYLGHQQQHRDSVARILPHWNESMPHYGFLMGMYSFGLVETRLYDQAEKTAKKGLEINKHDSWSSHSLAHVFEMAGRFEEGRKFMKETENDWASAGMLACHLYWHWALYDIERGCHNDAVSIFDAEVAKRVQSGAMLDIVDACSLLFRLELEGINVSDRWEQIFNLCQPHIDDHILTFNDVHFMMSCLGSKNDKAASDLLHSMKTFAKECVGDNATIAKYVGIALCESLLAYGEGDFEKAVDLVLPIRYQVLTIGGSDAQRDIFNLYLIVAAMKSSKKKYKLLSRQLLLERKALKENAPLTDRLMARAMSAHLD